MYRRFAPGLRAFGRAAFERVGLVTMPIAHWHALQRIRNLRHLHRHDVKEIEELYGCFVLPGLPPDPGRARILYDLEYVSVGEGLYLVDCLHRVRDITGDIVEFGCNEGATSRLLAHEILPWPSRLLWLFDSFEGLPAPSEKDRLIDDISQLGSIAAYRGELRANEDQVREKLRLVPFPAERTRIVRGWIDETLKGKDVPEQVAFAFVDFDFYQPIRTALEFLDRTTSLGGLVIVDDYGFFSEGAQLAVDEFVAERAQRWTIRMPHPAAGKFCILQRV